MSGLKQILLSLVVVVIAGLGWLAYDRGYFGGEGSAVVSAGGGQRGPGGGGRGPNAAPVVTATVETDTSSMEVRAVGTAAAVRAVTLYPEVAGVVDEVAFQPGTTVAEGQELVHLRDADQQVAVERARIALDDAEQALERAERLAQTNNITTVALADTRSAARKAEIDLRSAELELAKRSITAPFAGTIGLTDITVGDLVNSSTPLTTLDDMSTVTVAFDMPERASGRVAVGQEVTAATASIPDRTFTGTVSAIDSRVDPTARTLRVEATLPNEASALKPGMAVTVELRFPEEEHPMVPSLAVQWDRDGPYVWKVTSNGTVQRADVRIIGRRSGSAIVVGDLSEGDEVVVEGLQRLRDGGAVTTVGGDDVQPSGGQQAPAAGAENRPRRQSTDS